MMYYILAGICFFVVTAALLRCTTDLWREAFIRALYTWLVVALIPLGVFLIYIGQKT